MKMTIQEAFDIVMELAEENQIANSDCRNEPDLQNEIKKQKTALRLMARLERAIQ